MENLHDSPKNEIIYFTFVRKDRKAKKLPWKRPQALSQRTFSQNFRYFKNFFSQKWWNKDKKSNRQII